MDCFPGTMLVSLIVGLLVGATPAFFLSPPLGVFLRRVAGDNDLAEFWLRYVALFLVIAPMACAALVDGMSSALRAALVGEVLALAMIGRALQVGARRERTAECRTIAFSDAPPRDPA